jgi:3-oxosteroid 1-dehydrogenase
MWNKEADVVVVGYGGAGAAAAIAAYDAGARVF